jgi:ABC-2 type transport system ATP-binding protein
MRATMREPAIVVRDLHMSYGPSEVLHGIDVEVGAGEVFGLLGPNGAGKTTTIEILEGFRRRTAGQVTVLGRDPERPTRDWRDRIGIVLQECELNPLLTVKETLSMFACFYRRPRSVRDTMDLVGLGPKDDARVGSLSGGEQRRLDVGVALVGDPDLLFLDEPTTGFDPSARRGAWTMVEGLRALGKTVVLTTHYMDEANHLADRVAILRAGVIAALGSPAELAGDGAGETVISFGLREPSQLDGLRASVREPLEVAGGLVTLRSRGAQHTLYELTSWAEREGVELAGLEARRPTLEDTFLEVIEAGDG